MLLTQSAITHLLWSKKRKVYDSCYDYAELNEADFVHVLTIKIGKTAFAQLFDKANTYFDFIKVNFACRSTLEE
jgi:hypothetical protein